MFDGDPHLPAAHAGNEACPWDYARAISIIVTSPRTGGPSVSRLQLPDQDETGDAGPQSIKKGCVVLLSRAKRRLCSERACCLGP